MTITRGEETRDVPRARAGGDGLQPLPVRQLPSACRAATRATASSRCDATTAPSSPGRSPTGSTSTARSSPSRRTSAHDRFAPRETSAVVRARVSDARLRQLERYADRSWRLNSQAPGPVLQREWPLAAELQQKVDDEIYAGRLTRRGATRVHRLAWTDRRPRPGRRAGLHPARHRAAAATRTAPARRQPAPEGRRMTASDRERLARVALGTLGEPGDPRLVSLVAELGAVLVHDQLAAGYDAGDGVQDDIAARLVGADPARDLERAERAGIRFVVPGDDEWPTQVDQLLRTETLRDRGGPPLGLWVRGPMGLDELESSVAVVGSRSATSYGTTDRRRDRRRGGARGLPGRLGRGVRHRPGRPPGRAGRRRPHRRGAGLWCRPSSTRRPTTQLLDHLVEDLRRGLRAATGAVRVAHPLPEPQPPDRRPHPRHRRGRGGRPQRGAQHRRLGSPSAPAPDVGARPGHGRPVRGHPRAAPQGCRQPRHPRRGGPRAGRPRAASTSSRPAADGSTPATACRRASSRCSTRFPAIVASAPTPSPGRPASACSTPKRPCSASRGRASSRGRPTAGGSATSMLPIRLRKTQKFLR